MTLFYRVLLGVVGVAAGGKEGCGEGWVANVLFDLTFLNVKSLDAARWNGRSWVDILICSCRSC